LIIRPILERRGGKSSVTLPCLRGGEEAVKEVRHLQIGPGRRGENSLLWVLKLASKDDKALQRAK
jgi:hypothetical protein